MKQYSLIEKAFFLKKVRLFAELDFELLLAVAEKLSRDEYDAKEKIFTVGQVANRIYFIFSGSVQLFDEKMNLLTGLHSEQYFGDEALFNDLPRGYTAIAKTDTQFFTLSRSHLLSIITECPSIAIALLQAYATNLTCQYKI